jgi:hypothetical protein
MGLFVKGNFHRPRVQPGASDYPEQLLLIR